MAAELKQAFGADTELIPGGRGDFDVTVDGSVIFSKKQLDRFPEEGEVQASIRNA
ncbi:MAG TPA: SelT/SelW/SelH family protein [Deltaproteobacteria bacterium]|nr:hypothetical protein [Deltaproteobacteria bacterium]HIL16229.1 SelT/SelW/SelH family protein [Deltaproteobacteria bacterium]